jgi:outer membrane protein TolC
MKKICKMISVTLAMIMIFSTAVSAQEVSKGMLTLDEAIKLAESNNRQAIIDDLEIASKETAYKEAKEDADMSDDRSGTEDIINERIHTQAYAIQAEMELETAKLKKADNAEKLKDDVTAIFYEILLTEKELENELKKLEIVKERLSIATARYNSKSITEDDLNTAQYNLDKKELDVESIREKLNTLDIKLKSKLNLPFDTETLKLSGTIKLESFPEVDINKAAAQYAEREISVVSALGKYNAAQKIMEETEKFLREGSFIYDDNRVDLEIASRDYEAAKRNAEVNIRNTYNELLSLRDSVVLAQKYQELTAKKLESAKTRYQKGFISKESYLSAEEAYLDSIYNSIKAVYDFNMKLVSFNSMMK